MGTDPKRGKKHNIASKKRKSQHLKEELNFIPRDMSRYTERQEECVEFLENLVHRRFSQERLNEVLSMFFGEDIVLELASEDELLTDFNLVFNLEREDQYGYFDIYMLPMRTEGFGGSTMYITEVAYEFE